MSVRKVNPIIRSYEQPDINPNVTCAALIRAINGRQRREDVTVQISIMYCPNSESHVKEQGSLD